MMVNNTAITMYESFYLAGQNMTIEDRVKFYESIMEYGFYGKEPELDGIIGTVFTAIKPVIDRSQAAREYGRRGGRPKKDAEAEKTEKSTLLSTLKTEKNRKEENRIETKGIETEIEKKKKESIGRFAPPSFEQVSEYCAERSNGIDPQAFIDFYESKGWMIGKNKMKDWKAAIRTWEQRSNAPKKEDNDKEIRKHYENARNLYPMETKRDEGLDLFMKKTKGDAKIARRLTDKIGELVEMYYNGERCLQTFEKDIEVAYADLRN